MTTASQDTNSERGLEASRDGDADREPKTGSVSSPRRKYIPESFIAAPLLFLAVYLSLGGLVKFGVISSLFWAFVYLGGLTWFLITPRRTIVLLAKYWPLLLLPAIALASAVWSEDPAKTVRTGIQFTFSTLLAIRIGTVLSPASALGCVFAATLLGFCLSLLALVAPPLQPAFESGNDAFIGIYVQKTVAGLALALFVMALCARGALNGYAGFALFVAVCIVPLLVLTKSVTAMVLLVCLSIIIVQDFTQHRGATLRFALFLFTVAFISMLLLILWIDQFDLPAFLLNMVGKSATLTGRTDIWKLGVELTQEYPFLGYGYAAFWGNPVFAEEWGFIHATVDPRLKGFHNLYVTALASTGIAGLFFVVVVYYWTFFKALSWLIASGTAEAAFWLAVMTSAIAISFVDNVLFAEHEFFHIASTLTFVLASRYAPPISWKLPRRRRAVQRLKPETSS